MNESVHAEAAPSSGASNHSSGSGEQKRAAYIPPHMRNAHRAPAAAPPSGPTAVQNGAANGVQGSRWSAEYVFTFLVRYFLFATLGHCILSHRDFSCNETNIQNCSVVICPLKKWVSCSQFINHCDVIRYYSISNLLCQKYNTKLYMLILLIVPLLLELLKLMAGPTHPLSLPVPQLLLVVADGMFPRLVLNVLSTRMDMVPRPEGAVAPETGAGSMENTFLVLQTNV